MEKEFARKRQELALKHKAAKAELDKSNKKLKQQAKSLSKKEQKDINKKIAASELELKAEQKSDVEKLEAEFSIEKCQPDEKVDALNFDAIEIGKEQDESSNIKNKQNSGQEKSEPKISKAEKRRRKKAEEERELQKRIQAAKDEQAKNLGKSSGFLEQKYISEYLQTMNLECFNIRSDGSCLYAAILKSQSDQSKSCEVEELRHRVAEYLEKNTEDYSGFIEGDFQEYLRGVVDGSVWGGELELTIISKLLDVNVTVVKWNGNTGCETNKFTPEIESSNVAIITYHRHLMQSEHYNGTITKQS